MARSHTLDIYGAELHLVTSKREWKRLAKTYPQLSEYKPTPETHGCTVSFTVKPKRSLSRQVVVFWINVRDHDNAADLIDTLAHEASHAAGEILDGRGHVVPGTDEPHAYLVGWLTRFLFEGCAADAD